MRYLITSVLCLALTLQLFSWGFYAHRKVNHYAVFTLPKEIQKFYKENIEYLSEHSVDPDKRRYSDENEAPRHYIDIDYYGVSPFDNMPQKWENASVKYTEDTLIKYGIVPWHIMSLKEELTQAFKNQNKEKVLSLSSDIGHYIADACVPLHTTLNYDGQLTNQKGIHALWESRIPELLGDDFNYMVANAKYIEDPLNYIWLKIEESFNSKDSVLEIERKLTRRFTDDKKYINISNETSTRKKYSKEFIIEYNNNLNGMVERRIQTSILAVGSLWYTCWIDAGKPNLTKMLNENDIYIKTLFKKKKGVKTNSINDFEE